MLRTLPPHDLTAIYIAAASGKIVTMDMYFGRDGKPISMQEWVDVVQNRPEEKFVAKTELDSGRVVSTVWLGLNHRFEDGPPLIFETMVFPQQNNWGEEDMERYSTLEEAKEGHERMVDKWRGKKERTVDE